MFQRFFVPLDGSVRAEKAIPVAARLAHAEKGIVTLARVIPPPISSEEYGAHVLTHEIRQAQAEMVAKARAYLDDVMERYDQELDGIHVVLETAPGPLPSTLLTLSDQEHSDLIVMCSRGEHWLKRWVFGSVAQATFRHSPIPVLVLSEHDEHFSLENRSLRILVPLDGSELAEAVLDPIFQFLSLVATPMPHEVHLLRIIATPPVVGRFRSNVYITDALQKEERQEAERQLQTLVERLSRANPLAARCAITTSVVINPDVAGTIVRQTEPIIQDNTGQKTYSYEHGRAGDAWQNRFQAGHVWQRHRACLWRDPTAVAGRLSLSRSWRREACRNGEKEGDFAKLGWPVLTASVKSAFRRHESPESTFYVIVYSAAGRMDARRTTGAAFHPALVRQCCP